MYFKIGLKKEEESRIITLIEAGMGACGTWLKVRWVGGIVSLVLVEYFYIVCGQPQVQLITSFPRMEIASRYTPATCYVDSEVNTKQKGRSNQTHDKLP